MITFARLPHKASAVLAIVLIATSPLPAQTTVALSNNRYTPEQDVSLGRQAAEDIEEQLPLLRDRSVNAWSLAHPLSIGP